MAVGRVSYAGPRLESATSTASLVHDNYVQSLRLTLEMRHLEVRIWEWSLQKALKIAKTLVMKVRGAFLAPVLVQWITQQSLALSNRLVWAGKVTAASLLLQDIIHKYVEEDECTRLTQSHPRAISKWSCRLFKAWTRLQCRHRAIHDYQAFIL